jgi:hypothetical protein
MHQHAKPCFGTISTRSCKGTIFGENWNDFQRELAGPKSISTDTVLDAAATTMRHYRTNPSAPTRSSAPRATTNVSTGPPRPLDQGTRSPSGGSVQRSTFNVLSDGTGVMSHAEP